MRNKIDSLTRETKVARTCPSYLRDLIPNGYTEIRANIETALAARATLGKVESSHCQCEAVMDTGRVMILHPDASTFPNRVGTEQLRRGDTGGAAKMMVDHVAITREVVLRQLKERWK